jgi:hypothetical protein
MRTPDIEVLWWDGCPSTEPALGDLRRVLAELGLDGARIRITEVRTDDEARSMQFVGSPTILIDGEDPLPAASEEPFGLTCRIYRRRDGRISATPDPEDLRRALREAAEDQQQEANR